MSASRFHRQLSPKRVRKPRSRVPPAATIRKLAETCASLAEAENRLVIDEPLVTILDASEPLRAAWDKGRRVRRVRQLAAAGATVHQAAQALGTRTADLADQITNDMEVRESWLDGRLSVVSAIAAVRSERFTDGDRAAVSELVKSIRREIARTRIDLDRLTLSSAELAALVNVTRQTMFNWTRSHGLPQVSRGEYSIKRFLTWYTGFIRARCEGRREGKV